MAGLPPIGVPFQIPECQLHAFFAALESCKVDTSVKHECTVMMPGDAKCTYQTFDGHTTCPWHAPVTVADGKYGNPNEKGARPYRVHEYMMLYDGKRGVRTVDVRCTPEYFRGFTFNYDQLVGALITDTTFIIDFSRVDEETKKGSDIPGVIEGVDKLGEAKDTLVFIDEDADVVKDPTFDGWSWIYSGEIPNCVYSSTNRAFMKGLVDGIECRGQLCDGPEAGFTKFSYRGQVLNLSKPDMYKVDRQAIIESKGDTKCETGPSDDGVIVVPKDDHEIIMNLCRLYDSCEYKQYVAVTGAETQ